ncbi:MAG: GtrA family protein [Veillonella sp.]
MKSLQYLEMMRFIIVGAITFVVDYGLLYISTEYIGLYYMYSTAIAFIAAVIFNYWLCVIYVFKNVQRQTSKQAILFVGSSVVGLGLNQICMWFFVEIFGIYYMLAKIISIIIVMAWNYIMKRKAVLDK